MVYISFILLFSWIIMGNILTNTFPSDCFRLFGHYVILEKWFSGSYQNQRLEFDLQSEKNYRLSSVMLIVLFGN